MGKRWSAEEIANLKNWAGKRPSSEIATDLGRKQAAIAVKAHELRVSLRVRQTVAPGTADGMDLSP